MVVQGTNGHASFIVPISTTDEQNAGIVWHGFPAATDDWTAEVSGYNNAGWSTNGDSEFKFLLLDLRNGGVVGEFAIRMAVGAAESEYVYPKCFVTVFYPNGVSTVRHSVAAASCTFGLRLIHKGGLAGDIAAWYDPTGTGTAWTLLDVITVSDFSPSMTATDTFAFEIMADCYYGPILERDIWAGDFQITNSALGSALPQLSLIRGVRAVTPSFSDLILTTNYQLQVSSDLSAWTNMGPAFSATNASEVYGQPFDVSKWNHLFFRLQSAP